MRRAAIKFRDTVLLVPARLPGLVAASLLGISDLVFSAMTRDTIVSCLGTPPANGPKHYHGPYVLWLRAHRGFLDQSERYAKQFWAERNGSSNRAPNGEVAEKWTQFSPPKFHPSANAVTTLDPVIGIGAVEEILGFREHEIRILYHQGLLQPIGGSDERFKHKRFFLADVLTCHADRAWLDRAERCITAFWRKKNHP
jgi:hypothetical protein